MRSAHLLAAGLTLVVGLACSERAPAPESRGPDRATASGATASGATASGATASGATASGAAVTPATTAPPPGGHPVLVGAGDIAVCGSGADEATAALLDAIPGTVFTLGDNVYDNGTAAEFRDCYGPSWGRHRERTRPSAGNHDYHTRLASGYFGYFGAAAGDPEKGYYSYDLGEWHVVVLNSNSDCTTIGCDADSPQLRWLRADLQANAKPCTLAYWHHPRFNSGEEHGSNDRVATFWQVLHDFHADVVLNGHEHVYERFAPQTPAAVADPAHGIRQFTVGTGGRDFYPIGAAQANSEVRQNHTHGVLELTLRPGAYDWRFVPVAGKTFADAGTGSCHR